MAITQSVVKSLLLDLATKQHDFTASSGDTFKMALYPSSATLNSDTTAYSATNEVSGTGYSAGGATMTVVTPVQSGDTLVFDFDDVSWASSTLTARGALVYNSSNANKAVIVLDFGSDRTSSSNTFLVTMPAADSTNAIIRLKLGA